MAETGPELVSDPTGEARRRIGQWPTPDRLAERLLQVVEDQAEHGPEDERPRWRRVRDGLANGTRDVTVRLLATALGRTFIAEGGASVTRLGGSVTASTRAKLVVRLARVT